MLISFRLVHYTWRAPSACPETSTPDGEEVDLLMVVEASQKAG